MKIIKKYTAFQITTKKVNDDVVVNLEVGRITGPYYDIKEPEETFDTEEEAIEWAYKENKWCDWLILPKISFEREY